MFQTRVERHRRCRSATLRFFALADFFGVASPVPTPAAVVHQALQHGAPGGYNGDAVRPEQFGRAAMGEAGPSGGPTAWKPKVKQLQAWVV